MFVTIITDCHDDGTKNRQTTRSASFFNTYISFVGLDSYNEIEAAGNIIDTLDAAEDNPGIIMANCAPRHGKAKKWKNGTPFGYFKYKNTLIVSTVDGYMLSLAKKFGLIDKMYVTDIPTVLEEMVKIGQFPEDMRIPVINTQFRSFEYMPRLAKWVHEGVNVPAEELPLEEIADAPHVVWWVDNFGNCKTTMLAEEIGHEAGKKLKTRFGEIICYDRLKDVPNGETGLIIGSSGLGKKRFIEFVIQGKSAAGKFDIKTGDTIIE